VRERERAQNTTKRAKVETRDRPPPAKRKACVMVKQWSKFCFCLAFEFWGQQQNILLLG
jgi:hypothetical protein